MRLNKKANTDTLDIMKVLVIGSGGREHAICWALAQSPSVTEIICVPGNGGTAQEPKCKNIDPVLCSYITKPNTIQMYAEIAKQEHCSLAVIGPEDPLAAGAADILWEQGIPVVGPKKTAAQLEASKDTAKHFMQKYGVACAESTTFTDSVEAQAYIMKKGAPLVIKADGLAAGKGVVVAATTEDALSAVDSFMNKHTLGDAGTKLVIEEYLQGVEISILAAVSVTPESAAAGNACIVPFVPARDHKRLMDGARGPNTGGMGAVAPLPDVTPGQLAAFEKTILQPTLQGMIAEQMDYRGFIFFGIMLTAGGPKLLEYNVRLGDPETQAVLPLIDFDFAELCTAVTTGTLNQFKCVWKPGFVCAPVVVSGGYPQKYQKGLPVSLPKTNIPGTKIFIAGASIDRRTENGRLVTSGGRVLAAAAHGTTAENAREAAYDLIQQIQFDGMFYRRDIGLPGAAESKEL